MIRRQFTFLLLLPATASVAFLGACNGFAVMGEKSEGHRVAAVGHSLDQEVPLPDADAAGSLGPYFRYALYKNPRVDAAYNYWRSSVTDVTVARSLPDPRLTLQFDYAGGSLMSFMPGVDFGYTTPGKRAALGRAALLGSRVAYRDYVSTLFYVATDLRSAWVEFAYSGEALELMAERISAQDAAAGAAESDYVTAPGGDLSMISLLHDETAAARVQYESMRDRRAAAQAAFKSAMGLYRESPDPAWPVVKLTPSAVPDEARLWAEIKAGNPGLLRLRASVEAALAGVGVAKKSGTPDYSFGAMADLKVNPVMLRPQGGISLPIWRDKIRAENEAAKAREKAAGAELRTAEVELAARLAKALYEVRAADRRIAYLDTSALPSLRAAEAIAQANFQSGIGSATAPAKARVALLSVMIERLDTLREREMAATELSLLTASTSGITALPTKDDANTFQ